jgi:hypothetical protein
MNNLSSYCGLVNAKIRALDKDLPVQSIEDFYFDGSHDFSMDNWALQNLSHAFGDSRFLYGTDKMAHQLAKHTKTYYYHFDHLGSYSLGKDLYRLRNLSFT